MTTQTDLKNKTEVVSLNKVESIYSMPFLDLIYQAATVHREHHNPKEVQLCTLLSVKTGGCPEDCGYCPQAARYQTGVEKHALLSVDDVLKEAGKAKDGGSTRFCMGAAWREVKDGKEFDNIIDMVKGVKSLGLEACCTLGMVTRDQANRLAEAGLTSYNHNLDTSEDHYDNIIHTRTYEDRLKTISAVSDAGISLCCGGIVGLGETEADRIKFLHTLANLDPQPESVPINSLVPIEGTPLENASQIEPFDWIRTIAVARILMPHAMVRLSAGRMTLSKETQTFAFLAGANSIFTGEKLLTTPNPEREFDERLLGELGLVGKKPSV